MCLSCAERQWDICCIVFSDILSSENIKCCVALHSQQVRKEVAFTDQRIFTRCCFFFFVCFVLKFFCHSAGMWDFSSLTRDGTNVPCIRSMES